MEKSEGKEYNDYEEYDLEGEEPAFLTEHDKDAWLATPKMKKSISKPSDILGKDLRNSFIEKDEAWIFGQLAICQDDWISLGMEDMATSGMAQVVAMLSTFASVQGNERIAQLHPTLSLKTPFRDANVVSSFQPSQEEDKKGRFR